jgi:hypothetical protein
MADAMFMFPLSVGISAFLVALLFALRTRRHHRTEHHGNYESHSSSSLAGGGRRIKKFRSDGTPVHE